MSVTCDHQEYVKGCPACHRRVDPDGYARLYGSAGPGVAPAESGKTWPLAARAIAAFRSPEDAGIGDTLGRNLARFGGDAFKRIYHKLTGQECGCADRQAALNRLFPYSAPRNAGVVVGCYGLPNLARLQVGIIREFAGDVPILIADDCSPHGAEFRALAKELRVDFHSNPRRFGHYAGDLSVFRRGIAWGLGLGLDYVAKLSQRMLLPVPSWLGDAVKRLSAGNASLLCQRCTDSGVNLFWRTEALVMRLRDWGAPAVLEALSAERLGGETEKAVNGVVVNLLGGRAAIWDLFLVDRYRHDPRVVFHTANLPADYHRWAARYGVKLDAGFNTGGWQHQAGYLVG